MQLYEWVQILATGLIIVSVTGICGLYDYKRKIITSGSGFAVGWMFHLGFNMLLFGAAKSRCRYYVIPWLVEGVIVIILLGVLGSYSIYCGVAEAKNCLKMGAAVKVKVIYKLHNYYL